MVAREREGDNAQALSITEISRALKRAVEDRFGYVRVRGEISRVSRPRSGHVYTTLKDDGANLDAVIWKGNAARMAFNPEEGMEIIATGKVTTYPGQSKYQIVIEKMELAGEGALLALLEKTRARLEAEGLFARQRKRPLPFLPKVIGVVTSPTGSVIRDILHRLADRFPSHVIVWPVLGLEVTFLEAIEFIDRPLFYVEETSVSPLSIAEFIATIWASVFMSRGLRRFLGERLYTRTSWDIGLTNALDTLVHYVVVLVGVVLGLRFVGIGFSSLAIFAGVLGIGIGFGLRNITENFISGLIILARIAPDCDTLFHHLCGQTVDFGAPSRDFARDDTAKLGQGAPLCQGVKKV